MSINQVDALMRIEQNLHELHAQAHNEDGQAAELIAEAQSKLAMAVGLLVCVGLPAPPRVTKDRRGNR